MDFLQVITTTESKEEAERIAQALLERRLAGCVQVIGPIESIYWWKGRIERSGEYICFIKTKARLYEELERVIKDLHSYEVPEIIALPITRGNPSYLDWLKEETKEG